MIAQELVSTGPMEYAEIFRHRGHLYDQAMREFPNVRRDELGFVFRAHPLLGHETVLDIPAGGGYLSWVIPDTVKVTELEISDGFNGDPRVVPTFGPWQVGRFDRCVCLAASHHISNKTGFLRQLREHVCDDGIVHLADVDASLPQTSFLDGFIGRYNGTGHDGMYPDDTLKDLAAAAGLRIVRDEILDTAWSFDSEQEGLRFVSLLFGIRDYPAAELHDELSRLGWRAEGERRVLPWRLRYVDMRRA